MQLKWKKIATYFLGLSTIGSGSAVAWEYGFIDFVAELVRGETINVEENSPKTNELDSDTLAWEEIAKDSSFENTEKPLEDIEDDEYEDLRTSEMAESTGGYSRTNRHRPSGLRIGCICMDDDRQGIKGGGSCAGHGGVRFWLYKQTNGFVLEHPTDRHKSHPSPLSEEELSNLSSYNKKNSAIVVVAVDKHLFLM